MLGDQYVTEFDTTKRRAAPARPSPGGVNTILNKIPKYQKIKKPPKQGDVAARKASGGEKKSEGGQQEGEEGANNEEGVENDSSSSSSDEGDVRGYDFPQE